MAREDKAFFLYKSYKPDDDDAPTIPQHSEWEIIMTTTLFFSRNLA